MRQCSPSNGSDRDRAGGPMPSRWSLTGRRAQAQAVGAGWWLAAVFLVTALVAGADAQGPKADPSVLVTRVDTPVTPVVSDHLLDLVSDAEAEGHEALVVEIDTPGGLDAAMRDIVQAFMGADVAIVVYVTPSGARAASAGALIAWASHVVAMAPGTTIGAATPVDLGGGEVGDKVVNDAAAYARAIAGQRGRNVDVAAEAVTEGRALSDSEALDLNLADLRADDRHALLESLDGRQVHLPSGTTTLRTAGAAVEERDMAFLRQVLQRLADPNLAFLFMSLGTLGLIYELATPGIGLAGGAGLVFILLALFGLAVLPIDAVGLLFLVVATALFVVELFAPGIGIAAAAGAVFLGLAGVFLFPEDTPGLSLRPAALVPTVMVVGAAVVAAGRLALRARRAPTSTGIQALVERELIVARAEGNRGRATADGAWWNLRSDNPLQVGERVQVARVEGLDLVVKPATTEPAEQGP